MNATIGFSINGRASEQAKSASPVGDGKPSICAADHIVLTEPAYLPHPVENWPYGGGHFERA